MGKPRAFLWEHMEAPILWYLAGLITADGGLSSDGRHIIITAKDAGYLEHLRDTCAIPQKVSPKANGRGQISHQIQIGSISFYKFLQSIGLTPAKTKTLGSIAVPDDHFPDFVRGVIDGDGSIRNWPHPTNGGEQWSLRIYSAAESFICWLQEKIQAEMGALGKIHYNSTVYVLKYGKLAAQRIFQKSYNGRNPVLKRKYALAQECQLSVAGWTSSMTVRSTARVVELVDTRDSTKRWVSPMAT
jgi:hypothetical protein